MGNKENTRQKNAVIWTPGVTVDTTATLSREQIEALVEDLRLKFGEGQKSSFIRQYSDALLSSCSDKDFECPDRPTFLAIEEIIKKSFDTQEHIGGSPAISACADICATGKDSTYYAGNVPSNVLALISKYPLLKKQFTWENPITSHNPGTIAIEEREGRHKIMLSFSEGRSLSDIDKIRLVSRIDNLAGMYCMTIVGFGGLNKGPVEEYVGLIDKIKSIEKSGTSIKIFVGTNSFRNSDHHAQEVYNAIMPYAEIISFNETELRFMYRAVTGKPSTVAEIFQDMEENGKLSPLCNKIVICHSEGGAIAHYNGIGREPVLSALEFAVSGASLRCASGRYGTEKEIKAFSGENGRNNEYFKETFGCKTSEIPSGTVAVASHDLSAYKQLAITGAGAAFDGYFVSVLSRHLKL